MELRQYSSKNVTILAPIGRVDSHSVSALRKRIDYVTTARPANVVIDLAKVDFMDSSGLAVLVHGMKHCRASGGDLCLCRPAQPIRMVLELTRLDKAIDIFPGTTEALAFFNS